MNDHIRSPIDINEKSSWALKNVIVVLLIIRLSIFFFNSGIASSKISFFFKLEKHVLKCFIVFNNFKENNIQISSKDLLHDICFLKYILLHLCRYVYDFEFYIFMQPLFLSYCFVFFRLPISIIAWYMTTWHIFGFLSIILALEIFISFVSYHYYKCAEYIFISFKT